MGARNSELPSRLRLQWGCCEARNSALPSRLHLQWGCCVLFDIKHDFQFVTTQHKSLIWLIITYSMTLFHLHKPNKVEKWLKAYKNLKWGNYVYFSILYWHSVEKYRENHERFCSSRGQSEIRNLHYFLNTLKMLLSKTTNQLHCV